MTCFKIIKFLNHLQSMNQKLMEFMWVFMIYILIFLEGLSEYAVNHYYDCLTLMKRGEKNRCIR
jgi:hypothetical protein